MRTPTPDTELLSSEETSRTIRTPGWKLHFHEAGEGEAVLFLHGSGPGATAWSNFHLNITPLARTHRVLMLDQPGWGESDPLEAAAGGHLRAIEEFLDALGIEKVSLIGNSLGGINAIEFAMVHPERVHRIVTMGTADLTMPHLFSPAGFTLGLQEVYRGYVERTPEVYRRLVQVMSYGDRFMDDELIAERFAAAMRHEEHLDAFVARANTPREAPEWTAARVSAIEHETLLIHGRDDQVVPVEASLRLLAMIPNSRALIFNQCGHWAELERADEFNRAVADFLS